MRYEQNKLPTKLHLMSDIKEDLDNLVQIQLLDRSTTSTKSRQKIFHPQYFQVEDMSNPLAYLPQYQQDNNEEISCVQECSVCCGNICLGLAYACSLCCCKCSACVYELPTSQAGLVEEFGRFRRLLSPGFNMINPCTEQVTQVDMKIKLSRAVTSQCITRDNVKLSIRSSVGYRVTNPVIANYVLGSNLDPALIELTSTSIREAAGSENLDEVLTNRTKIVGYARQLIRNSMPPGIQIERVFMQDIRIPDEIVTDLSSAAKQRRISEANIISSQADVETAKLMKQSSQLLDTKAAMQIRYLQLVENLGRKGVKLIMPIGVSKKGFNQ